MGVLILPFLDFGQFLASEMGFKEDPSDPEDSEQPAISLLSHQPWNWRVSLSSIRGRLSLCLELSDFIEYTFIYLFILSFLLSCPKGGLGNT